MYDSSTEYFLFKSTGYLKPVEGWWLLLTCDPNIVRYYCWLAKTWGIDIEAGSRHGPHVSVVKGKKPNKKFIKRWHGLSGKAILFNYSNQVRHNHYHVWLDVQCQELSKIRQSVGLKPKPWHSFHMTIGRLKHGMGHKSHEPRPKKKKR